jgi:hypothetical protein
VNIFTFQIFVLHIQKHATLKELHLGQKSENKKPEFFLQISTLVLKTERYANNKIRNRLRNKLFWKKKNKQSEQII